MMHIQDYLTIGLVVGVGLLLVKNKDTLQSIGSGISSTVSGALNKIQNKVVKDEGNQA